MHRPTLKEPVPWAGHSHPNPATSAFFLHVTSAHGHVHMKGNGGKIKDKSAKKNSGQKIFMENRMKASSSVVLYVDIFLCV